MQKPYRFAYFLVLALLLSVGTASAQVVKGSISGSVSDPSQAAVPGAKVTATHVETGQVFESTSDSAGLFRLNLLPVGTYRVEVTQTGFRKVVLSGVSVSSGQDRGLGAIALELGEVTSTIEVSSAPPLMTTTEAQVSNAISQKELTSYPGIQENQGLDSIALFQPGVVANRDLGFSNTNGASFSVNGMRGRNNDQQIDGQNNNDNSVGGPSVFIGNTEWVEEYKITTGNFGPEFGRNSGSVVNIVTKSGSNDWKGTIFGTINNSALNTVSNTQRHFRGLERLPRFQDTFVGGNAGGPFVKDHIFFFGGFDTQQISRQTNFSASRTPTPTGLGQLAACFPTSTAVMALQTHGPWGIGGGNPQISGTPTTIAVAGCATGVEVAGIQRTLANSARLYDYIIRTDVNLDKDRFYGRYIYQRSTFFNNNSFGTAAAGYPNDVPARSHSLGLSYTRILSDRQTNEFRFNWSRLAVEFGQNSLGTLPGQSQIDQALARITFSDTSLLGFGPATNAPQGRIVKTTQLQDNWSYFLGRHQLKAGFNYTYQKSPNAFLPNINGSFRFANLGTLGTNTPNRIQIANGDPFIPFSEHQTFWYFGDDWKVLNNLTLNLGLTYSYYGQPANLFHDLTVARESDPSTAFWDPTLPIEVRTFPKIPAPKNNWGPSAGFAWTPQGGGMWTGEGKTVIRGGYRMTYDPPFYNIYLNISSATPIVFLQTIGAAQSATIPLDANPFGPQVRMQLSPFLTLGVFDPRGFNQTTIADDFGPQRVHHWSIGVQREIIPNAVVESRYVGNRGTNLFQSVNDNPFIDGVFADFPSFIPSGLTPCPAASAVVPSATGRVDCDRGIVRKRTNTGTSTYHGWQTQFRGSNLWRQLTVNTSYTWSKTTDNVSEIFGTFGGGGTLAFSQDPLNFTGGEKGPSGLDIPHNWTIAFQEDLPFYRSQQGWMGKILGGWSLAGSYILASGQTYTPQQFALAAFSGAPYGDINFNTSFAGTFDTVRPFLSNPSAPVTSVGIFAQDACGNYGVGCAQPAGTLLSLNDINTSGFVTETIVNASDVRFIVNGLEANGIFGTPYGDAGRNSLRNFWTNTGNFSVFKTTKFGERAQVRWHVTFTNVFNHPNFNSVDPFIDDAGFTDEGTGFGDVKLFSGGNRTIHFGLRISF